MLGVLGGRGRSREGEGRKKGCRGKGRGGLRKEGDRERIKKGKREMGEEKRRKRLEVRRVGETEGEDLGKDEVGRRIEKEKRWELREGEVGSGLGRGGVRGRRRRGKG